MRHPLIDETLADIATSWRLQGLGLRDLSLFKLPVTAVSKKIIRITCTHKPGTSQSKGDTRSVDCDPPAAPLLGNVSSCSGTTGWIEDEISGICSHEYATFDYLTQCLNHKDFTIRFI